MLARNAPNCGIHMFHLALGIFLCLEASLEASEYPRIWHDLYRELHPAEVRVHDPLWIQDPRLWAQKERERLEPIVVAVLRGERPDIPWAHVLPVARELAGPVICDQLFARLQAIVSQKPNPCYRVGEENAGSIAQIMDTLSKARDQRIASVAMTLAGKECQSSYLVEHCVGALRNVGNLSTLNGISVIPLRSKSQHIDRLCGMAEKSIRARAENTSLSPNAEQELRDVATRFVRSALAEDLAAYVACLPHGAAQGIDAGDMKEILAHADGRPGLAAVEASLAAGKPFAVDLDELRATLPCSGSFQLNCVLEVDGWKVANLMRIPTP